jgi:hypothetical protein
VIFELPTQSAARAFGAQLRGRWSGWEEPDDECWLFAAHLDACADIAPLLRRAQELVADLGLPPIRYSLDGRLYVLEPARPLRSACRALRST